MKVVREKVLYWLQLFLLPLYGLSFLLPRNKKIWLFGSTFGRRFAENPRYLFLYVSQNEKDLRPIWISHNKEVVKFLNSKNYEAYYYHSFRGIFYALIAGVYIFDNYSKDINFWQSGGAIKVNLWHGTGNKKINHDNEFDKVRHPKNLLEKFKSFPRRLSDEKPTDYTLATSDELARLFASAFATDMEHIIIDGYPRNDILFDVSESMINNIYFDIEKKLLQQINDFKMNNPKGKVIVYLPTFRESESKFFEVMDMEKFDDYLKKNNYLFVSKLHPKSRIVKDFESVNGDNIINVNSEVDVYSFLSKAEMLITDYSSIYSDFMLTKKPVVAFDYDWEEYSKDTRSCYIDQDEYMPEKKAANMDELIKCITEVFDEDVCYEKRMKSFLRLFKYNDGKSSKRIVEKIRNLK